MRYQIDEQQPASPEDKKELAEKKKQIMREVELLAVCPRCGEEDLLAIDTPLCTCEACGEKNELGAFL